MLRVNEAIATSRRVRRSRTHQIGQPAESEWRIRGHIGSRGAKQHGLARPDLRKPQFVDGNRLAGIGRVHALEEDDLSFRTRSGEEARAAIVEQQDDRPVLLEAQQV